MFLSGKTGAESSGSSGSSESALSTEFIKKLVIYYIVQANFKQLEINVSYVRNNLQSW